MRILETRETVLINLGSRRVYVVQCEHKKYNVAETYWQDYASCCSQQDSIKTQEDYRFLISHHKTREFYLTGTGNCRIIVRDITEYAFEEHVDVIYDLIGGC